MDNKGTIEGNKSEGARGGAFDSREEARRHVGLVSFYMAVVCEALIERAAVHDASKWTKQEYELRDKFLPELRAAKYGSAEYDAVLQKMKPAIDHHHQLNSHHPEYYSNGIFGMNLLDVVEMFCDWCAVMHIKGESLNTEKGARRYKIGEELSAIFKNTEKIAEEARKADGEPGDKDV